MQIPTHSKICQVLAGVLLGASSLAAAQNDMPLKAETETIIVVEPECHNPAEALGGLFYFDDCREAVTRVYQDPDHIIQGSKEGCIRLTDAGRCTTQLCFVNDGAVQLPWSSLAPYLQLILPTCQIESNKGTVTGGKMYMEGTHPYGQHHWSGTLYVGTEEGKPTYDRHHHDELRLAQRATTATIEGELSTPRRQRDQSRAVLAHANALELRNDPPSAYEVGQGEGYRLRVTFSSRDRASVTRGQMFLLMQQWQRNAPGHLNQPHITRFTEHMEPRDDLYLGFVTSNANSTPLFAAIPQRLLGSIQSQFLRAWSDAGPDRNADVVDRNRGPAQLAMVLEYSDPNATDDTRIWRDLAHLLFTEMHLENVEQLNENMQLGQQGGGAFFAAVMKVSPVGL